MVDGMTLSHLRSNPPRARAAATLAAFALLTAASSCAKAPLANAPQLGRLTVGVITTSPNLDRESMTFVVTIRPRGTREGIRADAGIYEEELPPGEYVVGLTGLPDRCRVDGTSERRVVVSARQATAVRFTVTCRGG
jgi:hypothetical protein